MSKSFFAVLLCYAVTTAVAGASAVPDAITRTNLIASSSIVLDGRVEVNADTFGTHQASYGGGLARAGTTVGANEAGVPFIAFNASASGRSFALATAQLDYYWSVSGAATQGELVPVTITTLGSVWGQVTARAMQANHQVDASADWLNSNVSTSLWTWSVGGRQDQRGYGVNLGKDAGTIRSAPGGSVTSSDSASFSETFTVLVNPNAGNRIVMDIYGGPSNSDLYNASDVAYSWALGGYIDPIITIDAAFADRFSVVQSSIPIMAVPVPEASTLALMLAGLGLVASIARRHSKQQ
jgi:hypothetical protein